MTHAHAFRGWRIEATHFDVTTGEIHLEMVMGETICTTVIMSKDDMRRLGNAAMEIAMTADLGKLPEIHLN